MSIECPYCDHEMNDPDECHDPSDLYEHQCSACEKIFVFTVDYTINYYPHQADCKNGGPHNYKKCVGAPAEYFANRYRCVDCEHEHVVTPCAS